MEAVIGTGYARAAPAPIKAFRSAPGCPASPLTQMIGSVPGGRRVLNPAPRLAKVSDRRKGAGLTRGTRGEQLAAVAPLAHILRGPGEAVGLVFAGLAALCGVSAFFLFEPTTSAGRHKGLGKAAVVLAVAFAVLAYAAPAVLRGAWTAGRPAATAKLLVVSPHPGQVVHGDPAVVRVELRLVGGRIVAGPGAPVSNEGHVHAYLDGELLHLSSDLHAWIEVHAGSHDLFAEFVARDHGPFNPPVRASLTFEVVR